MVAVPDRLASTGPVIVSPAAPARPAPGTLWFDPATGTTSVWASGVWQAVGAAGGSALPAPPAGAAGQFVFWGTGSSNAAHWESEVNGGTF